VERFWAALTDVRGAECAVGMVRQQADANKQDFAERLWAQLYIFGANPDHEQMLDDNFPLDDILVEDVKFTSLERILALFARAMLDLGEFGKQLAGPSTRGDVPRNFRFRDWYKKYVAALLVYLEQECNLRTEIQVVKVGQIVGFCCSSQVVFGFWSRF